MHEHGIWYRGKHSKILIGIMMMVKVVVMVAAATVTPVVGLLAHSDVLHKPRKDNGAPPASSHTV